jgi:hypothetical protein
MTLLGSRFFLVEKAEPRYCEKFGLTPFRHTTHPRFNYAGIFLTTQIFLRLGAAHAVLRVCGPKGHEETANNHTSETENGFRLNKVKYIVDCTLAYHKGIVPHFGSCLLGLWPSEQSMTVAVHYKIHEVNPEWYNNLELFKQWLYEQYRLKVRGFVCLFLRVTY